MLPSAAATCFWLVVVFWSANLRPIYATIFYFNYFCIAPFDVTNNGTPFPLAFHPPRAISPNSLPLLMPTLGWLLCFPFKFWPLKAKATPNTLFFDGVCVGILNRGTGHGTTKPDHGRLAWDHRRPRRHVLWAPLTYPWRERAKPLEGRGWRLMMVVVVCSVLCFVCCVVFAFVIYHYLANQLVEIDGG